MNVLLKEKIRRTIVRISKEKPHLDKKELQEAGLGDLRKDGFYTSEEWEAIIQEVYERIFRAL